jgi:hypothetical protein
MVRRHFQFSLLALLGMLTLSGIALTAWKAFRKSAPPPARVPFVAVWKEDLSSLVGKNARFINVEVFTTWGSSNREGYERYRDVEPFFSLNTANVRKAPLEGTYSYDEKLIGTSDERYAGHLPKELQARYAAIIREVNQVQDIDDLPWNKLELPPDFPDLRQFIDGL